MFGSSTGRFSPLEAASESASGDPSAQAISSSQRAVSVSPCAAQSLRASSVSSGRSSSSVASRSQPPWNHSASGALRPARITSDRAGSDGSRRWRR